jgi:nucleoid-associated protein YgaU
VISPRDTLTIIAKKFYKSATKADLARIVAANKGMLKDETTPLVVGKKLTITDVPAGKPTMPAVGPMTPVMSDVRPIDGQAVTRTPTPTPAAPVASKTYVVQKNDTIERIAKKFGGNTQATMKAIMAANGIKADTVLQVGQKLKVPDAAPTAVASEGHARM